MSLIINDNNGIRKQTKKHENKLANMKSYE